MSLAGTLRADHQLIKEYFRARKSLAKQKVAHESGLRTPFADLLAKAAPSHGWTFIAEVAERSAFSDRLIRPDGVLRDANSISRGWWESKDRADNLEREIAKKRERGYRLDNTIFEDSQRAILFQNKERIREFTLENPEELADLLNYFFTYQTPAVREFEAAVEAFRERLPDLARALNEKIADAHSSNSRFQAAFEHFHNLCRLSLNPNISAQAVDEMLVQHLLTERLVRTVFNNPDFVRQNVIAGEVERLVDALVSKNFSRHEFLKGLDSFYNAIEATGRTLPDFAEKQQFINTIYERFFQGWCIKTADTHGIVYTPQPIVDFMCASVVEILERDFGVSLGHPSVQILDPATGTGNFLVNLLGRIHPSQLGEAYRHRLFANEVMLLPYYIAALNIEHRFYEITGTYEPFPGLCFTDTLDIAEKSQLGLFTEANTERITAQRRAPINVIIGNPPYNVGQLNENDNNKNRKYEEIDRRVRETYSKDSAAQNRNSLSDVYVKFFRWAADRLDKRDGIVCYVTNNSFVDQIAFDGMRKHLLKDFTYVEHIDLHGNVRRNPKLSGTTHNVFGIQVGVGITFAVRRQGKTRALRYYRVPEFATKEEKLAELGHFGTASRVPWQTLTPDAKHNWLIPENADEFASFIPITDIFELHSNGLKTNRDEWVYDFHKKPLEDRMNSFIETYNSEVDRWKRTHPKPNLDDFVLSDERRIKWSAGLKQDLKSGAYVNFHREDLRRAVYRPFCSSFVYFNKSLNERVYQLPNLFPTGKDNKAIWLKVGSAWPFFALMVNCIPDLLPQSGTQVFAINTFDKNNNYHPNLNPTALTVFSDPADKFHYVYAVLHHPIYRSKFAPNLKRELPRIPIAPDFKLIAEIGQQLADLHLNYESGPAYLLEHITNSAHKSTYRVEDKMRWRDKDKTVLEVNPSLTLAGIPASAHEYKLGSRSALDWVVEMYQVSEDKRTGIRQDPNRPDDPMYIVNLVARVTHVSLETNRLVAELAKFPYSS